MPAYGRRLKLRLFLEGIEVPVISANIQTAPNSPTVASIQVPPLSEGTKLMPRTLVHLFFLDDYEIKSPQLNPNTVKTNENAPSPTDSQKEIDETDNAINELAEGPGKYVQPGISNIHYKLLFGGEVTGFAWNKNSSSRALVLQCQDWSNYWDYAYQWGNTNLFGPGPQVSFAGVATNLFTDFLSSKSAVILSLIKAGKCNSFPTLKGLAAGIIRLLESVGGSYYPNPGISNNRRIAGQNIFFSVAELRLHITHMIAAYAKDETSYRLMTRDGWGGLFGRILGGLGGQVSMRKVINSLSGTIFYETFGQCCPYYRPGLDNEVMGQKRVSLRDSADFGFIAETASSTAAALVVLRQDFARDANDPEFVVGDLATWKSLKLGALKSLQRDLRHVMTDPKFNGAPTTAKNLLSRALAAITKAIPEVKPWRPDAPATKKLVITRILGDAQFLLYRLTNLSVNVTPKGTQLPARLNQHVYRPDIWFGSPPRCNVIFPENYDRLAYQRAFLQEPTRLLLKTNDEFFGESFLFDKYYFAPQVGSLLQDTARLRLMMRKDLLDHELFTGILPVFEKMGEFNVFAAQGKNNFRTDDSGNTRIEDGTTKYKTFGDLKVGYAQRSANFLYFKYRYNARQMQVAGKFNPYIACGFPGLIVDKPVDLATIQLFAELKDTYNKTHEGQKQYALPQERISQLLGTHFLGNFTQISHAVSQQETTCRTEIGCSYPRQVDETVEFLGGAEKVQTVRKRTDESATRATVVAAISPPKVGSLGPHRGRITTVIENTKDYVGLGPTSSSNKVPLYDPHVTDKIITVPVYVPVTGRSLGIPEVGQIVGDMDKEIVFRAYAVDEDIPRYRREQVDLPVEEFVRPGWYDDLWKPSNIGKAYNEFFGIGSITDAQEVGDPSNKVEGDLIDPYTNEKEKVKAPIVSALEEGSSIQDAVEFLVLVYSYLKQNSMDIDEFIRGYTWRPIATMVDIFGTSDLDYTPDGYYVVKGQEGFHSRAFGPYDDLFGLVMPEIEDVLGVKRGTPEAQKADTRKRKYEAVLQYVSALQFSRALLG